MEKPMKKITQYFPVQLLGKQTIMLVEDRVVIDWKNIFSSSQIKVNLKDINPNYDVVYGAYDNWSNVSWFFLLVVIVVGWFPTKLYLLIPSGIAIIFFLFNFRKYQWIYFRDTNRVTTSFFVRYSGNKQERENKKAFVENVVSEIKKTQKI